MNWTKTRQRLALHSPRLIAS